MGAAVTTWGTFAPCFLWIFLGARRFFGNKVTFTVERTPGGTARTYTRFTDVVRDTIDARIYLGIHFRTGDVQSAILGKNVASWVASHFLRRA